MARWGARLAGLILLVVLALVMTHLYKQLKALEAASRPAATSTAR